MLPQNVLPPSQNKCLNFILTLTQSYINVETLILDEGSHVQEQGPMYQLYRIVTLIKSHTLLWM